MDLTPKHDLDQEIIDARQRLLGNPEDRDAMRQLAGALREKGEYREAIEWLQRLDVLQDSDEVFKKALPGYPGSRAGIACMHWYLGEHNIAIAGMHALASGVRSRKINYAGDTMGLGYGLLLYYMAVTAANPDEAAYALEYLKNRVELRRKYLPGCVETSWPGPIAQYLLGEISFETVLERNDRKVIKLNVPDAAERIERKKTYRRAEAFFYRGVKLRAGGDEARFLDCMRQCTDLGLPQSQEVRFARFELQRAGISDSRP